MTSIAPIHSLRNNSSHNNNGSLSDLKLINSYIVAMINVLFTGVSVFVALMYFLQYSDYAIKVLICTTVALAVSAGEVILIYFQEIKKENAMNKRQFIDRNHVKVIRNWPIPMVPEDIKKNQ
jgi:hypothetical protein